MCAPECQAECGSHCFTSRKNSCPPQPNPFHFHWHMSIRKQDRHTPLTAPQCHSLVCNLMSAPINLRLQQVPFTMSHSTSAVPLSLQETRKVSRTYPGQCRLSNHSPWQWQIFGHHLQRLIIRLVRGKELLIDFLPYIL